MPTFSVLFIGANSGTALHRAQALRRLGCTVTAIDPRSFLPRNRVADYWLFHTGGLLCGPLVSQQVLRSISSHFFDLVWIDGGEIVTPALVKELGIRFGTILNYCIDDPYGGRDGHKWRCYLDCVPLYDLIVVTRECNVSEAYRAGAREVLRVPMSSDEVAHSPKAVTKADWAKWASDVVFVGTWMPERGPFLEALRGAGVPLSIFGDRWQKAKEWPVLRSAWRGPGIYGDEDYAKAIQCAKVCIGLLSKGNRDQSTTRSFEIPSLGSALCAERTEEHLCFYEENTEAVFWSSPEECADKCRRLLRDAAWRQRLADAGRARCLRNKTTNEAVVGRVLLRANPSVTSRIRFIYSEAIVNV